MTTRPPIMTKAVSLPRAWALHNLDRAIAIAGPVGMLVWRLWPVRLLADVALGLARGKQDHDKRETLRRREIDRETRAAVKERTRR